MCHLRLIDRGTHDCWVVILVLLSLPLEMRFKNENIWIICAIPGPKQPKEMDSFLRPFVEELRILNGNQQQKLARGM